MARTREISEADTRASKSVFHGASMAIAVSFSRGTFETIAAVLAAKMTASFAVENAAQTERVTGEAGQRTYRRRDYSTLSHQDLERSATLVDNRTVVAVVANAEMRAGLGLARALQLSDDREAGCRSGFSLFGLCAFGGWLPAVHVASWLRQAW